MTASRSAFRLSPIVLFLLVGMAFFSTGCVTMTDLETSQENSREVVGRLDQPGSAVEQTFVMRRTRLNSLTIWAGKDPASQPATEEKIPLPLQVELFRYPMETSPIFSEQVGVSSSGPLYIQLPVRQEPAGQTYLVRLSAPQGGLEILGVNADVYSQGTAFINSQPLSADIAFRTTYDYNALSIWHDLINTLHNFWLILPLTTILLLPGWLLLDVSNLADHFDGGERLALSVGLSLSLIPLLMLWSTTIGMHWNRLVVIVAALVLTVAVLWRSWKKRITFHISPAGISLAFVFLLTLGVRLAMARDMAGPAWVDSVHHALITQLIEINGGFPPTYAPYVDTPANQYHSGFHSALASFQLLSDMQLQDGMLLFGNVLNAIATLSVYLFTTTLTRNRLAGLVAALISGLVTPMPAYYTSWGRYTELAGLLILPAALAFAVMAIEDERPKLNYIAITLACLAFTGLLLVHYRVLAFFTLLLAAYVVSQVSFSPGKLSALGKKALILSVAIVIGGFLLAIPWIYPNISRMIPYAMQSVGGPQRKLFSDFDWSYLTAALGKYSLYAAGFGFLLAMIRLKRFTITLLLWVFGMFFLANLGSLGLAGGSFVNSTSVEISLFMPLGLLGGYLVSLVIEFANRFIPKRFSSLMYSGFAAAGLFVAFLGAMRLLPLLRPDTELSRQGDRAAMEWIQSNIPQEETILINPFQWMVTVYAGNDGGYWIAPLSSHKTIPPPAIYGFGSNQQIQEINELCKKVTQSGDNPDQLWEVMQTNNLHYLYTGVRGGPISVSSLTSSPRFKMVYASQGAYIFKTLP
jgi:hypothetical protein